MYVEHHLEIVEATFCEALVAKDACVVYEDIDAAPLLFGRGNHGLYFFVLCDVGAIGHRLSTHGFDLSDHAQGCFTGTAGAIGGAAQIVDHNFGAALGELDCVAATQALACAGDDSYTVIVANRH